MHPFTLSRPADISAAITAHAHDAHLAFIAGGTDLIGLMKDRVTLPDRLLDINHLPDMAQIEALHDGGLRLGSLARMRCGSELGRTIPFSGHRRKLAFCSIRPTPKHGDHRREHHAADSLRILS